MKIVLIVKYLILNNLRHVLDCTLDSSSYTLDRLVSYFGLILDSAIQKIGLLWIYIVMFWNKKWMHPV